MPAAVIVRDSDGAVLGANRLAAEWFGGIGKNLSGRTLSEILPFSFDQQMTQMGLRWLRRRDEAGPTCVDFAMAEDPHDSSSSIVIFTEATEAMLRAALISEVSISLESSEVRKTAERVLSEVCLAVGRVMNLPLVEIAELQGEDCVVLASGGEAEIRSSVARTRAAAPGSQLQDELVTAIRAGRRPVLRLVESPFDVAKRDLMHAGIAEVAVWPFADGQLGLKLYSRSQHHLSSTLVCLAMTSFVSWLGNEMHRILMDGDAHDTSDEVGIAAAA